MTFSWLQYLLAFGVSFVGELYGAVVGGGGILIQSFLLSMGIPPHMAVANDVLASAGTSIGSILVYRNKALIRWNLVRSSILPVLLGALCGLFLLRYVSPEFIEKFVAITALVFLLYVLVLQKSGGLIESPLPAHAKFTLPLFAFALGFHVTFSGAGTATFGVYFLTLAFGLTFLQSLALLCMLFLIVLPVHVIGYLSSGYLHSGLLTVMISATLIAGFCGAHLAMYLGNKWLKAVFLLAVLGFALYLILT